MAEGVFSISADIIPVLDERQLETQAQALVKQFNSLIAKEIKPVQLTASTKGLEVAQTFTSRIITQLNIMDKDASGLNKTLSTTANIFDLAAKNAAGVALRGVRPIIDALGQVAPAATRAFSVISSLGSTAFNTARAGVLQFTNAINLTSTNVLGYAGNIRKAIQENTRFKDGLDFIKRSGDSLKTLPQTFANLQAQVIAGVSPLQRAADAGSGISRSLVPFLVVGVAVAREVSAISASIRTLAVDAGTLASKFVDIPSRVEAAFASFGKDGPAAKKAIDDLKLSIPVLTTELDQLVIASRGQGIDALKNSVKELRDNFVQTELHGEGLIGVIKRLFTSTDFNLAKAQILEINRAVLDLGADKGEVPFFKRFTISAQDSFSTVEELIRKLQPKLAAIAGQVASVGGQFATQGANAVKTSGIIPPGTVAPKPPTQPTLTPASKPVPAGTTVADAAAAGTAVGTVAAKAVDDAILGGLKNVGSDLAFFLKTAFAPTETVAHAEGVKIGEQLELGLTEALKTGPKTFQLPKPSTTELNKNTDEIAKIFQGGLNKRLTEGNVTGKVNIADAIGLNTANIEAATGKASGGLLSGLKRLVGIGNQAAAGAGGPSGGGIISKILGGAGGTEGAGGALNTLKSAFSGLAGGAGGLGEALGPLAGAAGLGGLAIAALNSAAAMETLKTALGGIFGAQAKEGFKQIQAFAAVTPFTTETATNAVIKLGSAFKGLSIPGGLAITNEIAGAAAAIGASDDAINRVTLAFTQIQAAGKLSADNVRQVTEALPNVSQVGIIDALAKSMGVTRDQAKSLYSQGLIPADKGLQAIIQAFHDVPGAAGALAKQSQTFTGLVSTAKDTVTQFLASIGGPLLAAAKPVLKVIIGYFQLLTEGAKAVGIIITQVIPKGFGLLINAIKPVRDALSAIADFIGKVGDKINELVADIEKVPFLKSAIDAVSGAFGGMGDSGGAAGEKINAGLKLALDSLDPVKRGLAAVIQASDPKEIIKSFNNLQDSQEAAHNELVKSDIDILKKTLAVKGAFDAQASSSKAVTDAQLALTDAVAKHDKELKDNGIKLEKELTDARLNTADANDKVAETQAKLNELLKGATTEDLEKSDIALAQAKLRLRQILEDEKKAQDELNAAQNTSIDLTGLSVDQIKSRLSVARAALAAQKALAAGPAGGTTEQKAINKDTATITKRQAELDIADAIKAQNDLRAKGSEKDPDIIAARKAVADAQKTVTADLEKEKDIQTQLNVLHGPDLDFEKTKKGLQEDITKAQTAQKDAAQAYQLAVLEAKGDQEGILKLLGQQINAQPELKKLLEQSNIPITNAKSLAELLGGEFVANKTKVEAVKSETELLNEALQKSIDLAKQFGLDTRALEIQREELRVGAGSGVLEKGRNTLIDPKFLPVVNEFLAQKGAVKGLNDFLDKVSKNTFGEDFLNNPAFKLVNQKITDVAILAATKALTAGVKDQGEINDAVKQALSTIPGIGPLKFADGGVVNTATAGIFGEAGREAILPLTRPMRMADILSHPQVLPPVLAALDKISLPQSREPVTDLSGIRIVRSAPQVPDHHVQAKRDAALAKAIVDEMRESGMSMGQTIVNNEFVAPDANDPLAKVHAAQIAREVKRQIEKLL